MVEQCRIIAVTPPGLCPQNITWTKTELSPVASKTYTATVPAPPTEVDDVLDADEDEAARNRRLEREARRNARKHNA